MIDNIISEYFIYGGFALLLAGGVVLHYICERFSRTRRLMRMIEDSLERGKK